MSCSPRCTLTLVWPSNVAHASVLASVGSTRHILAFIGRITGLKESEWGQIGVTQITSALAWTIDPPQLRLYAVLPVGVDIRTPSPYTVVRWTSLTYISKHTMNSALPLVILISLSAWQIAGCISWLPSLFKNTFLLFEGLLISLFLT